MDSKFLFFKNYNFFKKNNKIFNFLTKKNKTYFTADIKKLKAVKVPKF